MTEQVAHELELDLDWGQQWPRATEFRDLAVDYRVIPVVRKLLADQLTPVGIYRSLCQNKPGTFILESAGSDGRWSRWSFIGMNSRATLTAEDGQARWIGEVPADVPTEGNPIEVLRGVLEELNSPHVVGLPPLTGGMVGAIGWDAIRYWEPTLVPTNPDELHVPDVALCLASDLIAVDHHEGAVWLVANAINANNTDEHVDEAYEDALQRLNDMEAQLGTVMPGPALALGDGDTPEVRARTSQAEYEAAVVKGQQAITDGEVFQVVLSQRFDVDCPAEPIDVYRVLRTVNPSPYMYCVTIEDLSGDVFSVVGSSPETLVQVKDRNVLTFPIAGSRPRGKDVAQDSELAEELLADRKERAEHLMLVDLSRNDLLKACEPASVEVTEFMAVHRFSHIMHICSTVIGQRRDNASAVDVFTATFPAGTLSGAPKPRAVELINDLEPATRGIYGGTIGYFDFTGNLDMAIAIRTALIKGDTAYVQAGAGIVADSVPTSEYEECRNKAAAVVHAIERAARVVETP